MTARYYVDTPIASDQVTLTGTEAHHLIHVMRAGTGTDVLLFDGTGKEFVARVEQVSRKTATLQIVSAEEIDRELPLSITLVVALPKADRQRWLVEKAVELGVRTLVPIRTQRSVAQPENKPLERLRKTVIEASKQCGRNRLMEITAAVDWRDLAQSPGDHQIALMAHPDHVLKRSPPAATLKTIQEKISTAQSCLLAIGPEGGWTDQEVTLATRAAWQRVDLGLRIMRVETAAVFLTALVLATR